MNIIPAPPARPCAIWQAEFISEVARHRPDLPFACACSLAGLAHEGTWLLDGAEAAQLWLLAIETAAAERRRLPRDH